MAHDGARQREATLVERPELLVLCGIAGLLGSIAPTIMNVIASIVAQHDFIADTISDLGRGPHKWIMDTGFYISAAGRLGLSIGSSHAHFGRMGWSLGIFALALTAMFTVLLGVWDKIGNGDDLSVHTRLTFATLSARADPDGDRDRDCEKGHSADLLRLGDLVAGFCGGV